MTISEQARAGLIGEGSDDIYWELVTIEHETLAVPLRFVNAREGPGFTVTSRGNVFHAFPFAPTFPPRDPDAPFQGARIRIDNVQGVDASGNPASPIATLRGLATQARLRLEVVRRSAPDTVELTTTRLRLTGITYDIGAIEGTLDLPDFNGRRAGYRFTPDRYRQLRDGT